MHKVGRIPIALGLIAYGAALSLDSLGVTASAAETAIKFWPLLLVAVGAEYLWVGRKQENLRIDVGGAFLLAAIVVITSAARYLPIFTFGSFDGAVRTVSTTAPADGVKELRVKTGVGQIELRPGTGGITVEALLRAPTDADLANVQVLVKPGEVAEVTLEGVTSTRVNASYVVTLPQGLIVTAGTGTGSLTVSGYKGDLKLSTQTGRGQVESGAGTLSFTGGTGSITVRNFDGPVSATASTGRIQAENVVGKARLESGTGSVTLIGFRGGDVDLQTRVGSVQAETSLPLEGDIRIRAGTGSINLTVPEASSIKLNAHTSAGGVTVPAWASDSKSGPSHKVIGTSGTGDHQIDLETVTGSITLRH